MVFEMRTYSFHPGTLPTYLHLAQTVGRPVRRDDYGTCHGYWIAQSGRIDQVWHLWSYASLDERTRMRAELLRNERWTKEYGGAVLPLLQRQDVRFLDPVRPIRVPEAGRLYELRLHRARPGMARPWLEEALAGEPDAAAPSQVVGVWTGIAPQPNEVVQLLSHGSGDDWLKDKAARHVPSSGRVGRAEPDAMLAETESVVLRPTLFSPMQ